MSRLRRARTDVHPRRYRWLWALGLTATLVGVVLLAGEFIT